VNYFPTIFRGVPRVCGRALLGVALAGILVPLRAQEQPPQPKRHVKSEPQPEGLGRQLARESREAAGEGEKDETADFKQSAAVQWIAQKTGLSLEHAYLLCVLLNFAVMGGVLFWAARKYLPGLFRERTSAIQKAMQEAQKASDEARRRLAEIESRLMRLDGEIGMMRDAAEQEGANEEARIHAAAEADARKIVESARQEIAAAAKAARRELTAYAADLAVGLAQKQIRVDAATDQALVREFAGQLATAPDGPEDRKDRR
jgi:F-type H+-transporting ATPase subunit b